ncbi:MAG: DDE-type integrase/transposase/recombinase [Planctomycetaceae bacterium]|nr:DDE-type integrase/transposase/recombinase [Planctomycetaceae bacterium]
MKTLDLRAIQPKSFQPKTTQSQHRLGDNSNLLVGREPPSKENEVWVADITYIPLRSRRFGYLTLLMDLFSRRIVGWEYGRAMDEELVLAALSHGILTRQPDAGLNHHSDRGGQFASKNSEVSSAEQASFRA